MASSNIPALAVQPTEYEVEVAFIYNIAKFVEWPVASNAGGLMRLCILGNGPFIAEADSLRGKPIDGMTWEVILANATTNLKPCQMLFITESYGGNLHQVLNGVKGAPILTMGDTQGFAEQGVMINFYLDQNRVRFEINLDSARRSGLKLSSQLLKLARIVRTTGNSP